MAEHDFPPTDVGYPPEGGDILNELLIRSQLAEAERLAEEAVEAGDTPNNPIPFGLPGLAAQGNGTPRLAGSMSLRAIPGPEPGPSTLPYFPEDDEPDIPEGAFLLRCESGDVALWPEGISLEEHFIVLFFKSQKDLHFTPRLQTNFQGQYDVVVDVAEDDSIRNKLDLFYSGITFTIPDTETVAVIFHLRSHASAPTP
jgi:hypothetical protein